MSSVRGICPVIRLPQNIETLVNSEKRLDLRPEWDAANDPRYFVFTVPLVIGEAIIGGFQLRAKVSKEFVDRDALMQLEFSVARRHQALWRIQWRPLETHTNKGWGPKGYEYMRFDGTSHQHMFIDNWIPSEHRTRAKNLPGARPIEPDPGTLSEFIAFSGKCFRIKDVDLINLPPSTADMFWTPDG